MEEIWKDVIGYEGYYQVSNLGNIKHLNYYGRGYCHYVKQQFSCGYKRVMLCFKQKKVARLVHRLVAQSFIANPENKRTVNHKDGDKHNNCVSNLERATHSENVIHSFVVLKRKGSTLGKKRDNSYLKKKVGQYDYCGNEIRIWDSARDVGRELGLNSSNISGCCRGYVKQIRGFKRKYV